MQRFDHFQETIITMKAAVVVAAAEAAVAEATVAVTVGKTIPVDQTGGLTTKKSACFKHLYITIHS